MRCIALTMILLYIADQRTDKPVPSAGLWLYLAAWTLDAFLFGYGL